MVNKFINQQYDKKYNNDYNKKKFYEMYKKKNPFNLKTSEDFLKLIDDNIDNQSYQSFNADDISNYFIGLYIAFLNFNSHYERNKYTMVNNPRWPYGSNSFAIQSNIDTIYFQILDYNIGNFENIIIWEEHCKKVKETLDFIDENKLKVSEDIENLKEDMKTLDVIIKEFFDIISEKNLNEINLLDNKIREIKLKNSNYERSMRNSIIANQYYLYNFLKIFVKEIEQQKSYGKNILNTMGIFLSIFSVIGLGISSILNIKNNHFSIWSMICGVILITMSGLFYLINFDERIKNKVIKILFPITMGMVLIVIGGVSFGYFPEKNENISKLEEQIQELINKNNEIEKRLDYEKRISKLENK